MEALGRRHRGPGPGKITRILRVVEDYWNDIEGDFQEILHLDALDWIRGERSWPQFFRHYKKVSRRVGSATHSRLLTDPDLAAQLGELPVKKNPDAEGFTSTHYMLREIQEILLAQKAKDPRAVALPRPLTGWDLLSLRKRQAGMNRTIALFAPEHVHLTPQLSA